MLNLNNVPFSLLNHNLCRVTLKTKVRGISVFEVFFFGVYGEKKGVLADTKVSAKTANQDLAMYINKKIDSFNQAIFLRNFLYLNDPDVAIVLHQPTIKVSLIVLKI